MSRLNYWVHHFENCDLIFTSCNQGWESPASFCPSPAHPAEQSGRSACKCQPATLWGLRCSGTVRGSCPLEYRESGTVPGLIWTSRNFESRSISQDRDSNIVPEQPPFRRCDHFAHIMTHA